MKLLIFIVLLSLTSFILAEQTQALSVSDVCIDSGITQHLGKFNKNSNVNLIQTCDNCSFVNITSVINPNGTIILNNVKMAKSGTDYNFTLNSGINTSQLGCYIVRGVGDLNGQSKSFIYDFSIVKDINRTFVLDLNNTFNLVIFIIILIISGFMFYSGNNLFSGCILVLLGFVMLYSEIYWLFDVAFIIMGIFIIARGK